MTTQYISYRPGGGGGGGGTSIGGNVSGGTDSAVLFVHPTGILAQDPTNFSYDALAGRLTLAIPPIIASFSTAGVVHNSASGDLSTSLILNADVSVSAAIAYSKLALTGSIVNADVNASAAISVSKLAAITPNRAVISDGSGFVSPATTTATEIGYVNGVTSSIQTQLTGKQAAGNYITALTGDVAASGPGSATATIQAGAVVNSMVSASAAIAYSKLALTGSILNADVSVSAAIAYSKLATLATGSILLGNAGTPTATALSGDVTVSATGVTAIGATKVTNAMLAGSIDLTNKVSGLLPIANGGTNSLATATAGGIGYGTGTAHAYMAAGLAGQVPISGGASAPSWGTDVLGVATNSDAAAGYKAQFVEGVVLTPTAFVASATAANLASIALTAGDWDITAIVYYATSTSTTFVYRLVVNTTSASTTGGTLGSNYFINGDVSNTLIAIGNSTICMAPYRVTLTGNQTYYLNVVCSYTGTAPTYAGRIQARRMR